MVGTVLGERGRRLDAYAAPDLLTPSPHPSQFSALRLRTPLPPTPRTPSPHPSQHRPVARRRFAKYPEVCGSTPTPSSAPSSPTRSTCSRCSTSSPTSCCSRDSPAATTSRTTAGIPATSSNRSLDALKQAILDALMESGQFTPEMLEALRGGDDAEGQAKLAQLLDQLVQRLIDEGYLNVENAPQMPARAPGRHRPGRSRQGRRARRAVQSHRQGHRLPRLQDAAQPARLARQSRASAATTRRISPRASKPTAGASRTSSATCSTSTSTRR